MLLIYPRIGTCVFDGYRLDVAAVDQNFAEPSLIPFVVEGLNVELHLVEHEQEHLLYRISGLLGREHDVPADIAVGGSHLFERRNAVRLGDDGGVTETAEIGQEEQGIGARAHGILG